MSHQRTAGRIVRWLPLQSGLCLIHSHFMQVSRRQSLVGDHFNYCILRRRTQEWNDHPHLLPHTKFTNVWIYHAFRYWKWWQSVDTNQEKVLLITVYYDSQAVGGGVSPVRSTVKLQEGCGIEHPIHLWKQTHYCSHWGVGRVVLLET